MLAEHDRERHELVYRDARAIFFFSFPTIASAMQMKVFYRRGKNKPDLFVRLVRERLFFFFDEAVDQIRKVT